LSLDVVHANLNRNWALAGTSIAIFTFTLVFLYPRFSSGAIDPVLFQITLTVMGFSVFSFVFSGIYYYALTLALSQNTNDSLSLRTTFALSLKTKPEDYRRRADTFWVIGFSLLILEPSLILFTVGLVIVAVVWFVLWISYLLFSAYVFTQTQSRSRKQSVLPTDYSWICGLIFGRAVR